MTPRDTLNTSDKLSLAAGGVSTLVALAELIQGDYTMAFLASASAALTAGSTVSKFGMEKSKEGLQTVTRAAVSNGISFFNSASNLGFFVWNAAVGSRSKAAESKKPAAEKQEAVVESPKPKSM